MDGRVYVCLYVCIAKSICNYQPVPIYIYTQTNTNIYMHEQTPEPPPLRGGICTQFCTSPTVSACANASYSDCRLPRSILATPENHRRDEPAASGEADGGEEEEEKRSGGCIATCALNSSLASYSGVKRSR